MPTSHGTMSDRVRDVGEGLIVAFPSKKASLVGETIQALEGYFFKVSVSERFYYEYTQLGAFNNGDSLDYGYLGDTGHNAGDDVLRLYNDDFHAYHFGVGLESTDLRVYEKVDPSSVGNNGLDYAGQDGSPDPTDPSSWGYYNGAMVEDKYDPDSFTERVGFRNDRSGEYNQFGFYADDAIASGNANLHLVGRAYKLLPVQDSDERDSMLDAIHQPDDDADIPTTLVASGGMGNFDPGTQLPDEWDNTFSEVLTFNTNAQV